MRTSQRRCWAWISLVWLLVLLTGNLLHPLVHESSDSSSDCLVCVLQSAPVLPDDTGAAVSHFIEIALEPACSTPFEPLIKPTSPYASHLAPRAPPIG